MLKAKSIYAKPEKDDGARVLITRFFPRGKKKDEFDMWVKDLAPSARLLKDYKEKNITWKMFKNQYLVEINENEAAKEKFEELFMLSKMQNVTILCYEKEGEHCHRNILMDLSKRYRVAIAGPQIS